LDALKASDSAAVDAALAIYNKQQTTSTTTTTTTITTTTKTTTTVTTTTTTTTTSTTTTQITTTIITTTDTTTTTTPNVNLQISEYHICPRSMNKFLSNSYAVPFACKTAHMCRGNTICPANASACCQQADGCNLCVGRYY
jgi:hypothetical protein